ncbi:MAG: hypothetical protein LBQ98_04455 [Nitrososphaerota archaeon]|nr:hypothetical protein [Nitrososphaerota archaeon]
MPATYPQTAQKLSTPEKEKRFSPPVCAKSTKVYFSDSFPRTKQCIHLYLPKVSEKFNLQFKMIKTLRIRETGRINISSTVKR